MEICRKQNTGKLNHFKSIAVTHKNFDINDIGRFHLDGAQLKERLSELKNKTGVEELMFLSTCNRVEFLLNTTSELDRSFVEKFIHAAYPELQKEDAAKTIASAQVYSGEKALNHLFQVTSSLDSLVVGEREIITQVRNAYELCKKLELTGDLLRIVIQKAIECAKMVYTHTNISRNPVSVMSLAYRKLKELNVSLDAKFLIIGSGVTNTAMAKYLKKHGFANFVVFNRTLTNAQKLANDLSGKAYPLEDLKNYKNGFDVIVTCTGSSEVIITKEIYAALAGNDKSKKIVVDLAVPNDLDQEILSAYDVKFIGVGDLQEIAKRNLLEREKELTACEAIIAQNMEEFHREIRERKVELAMSDVPRKVKEIREVALNEVFVKDIQKLDVHSKETLDKVIAYLEKKYISVPMKMAKEILIEEASSK